jgi:beta-lactamase class A
MYCNTCGNKLNDNDLFCGECGTPVTGSATAVSGSTTGMSSPGVAEQPAGSAFEPASAKDGPAAYSVAQTSQQALKTLLQSKPLVIIAAIVALVIVTAIVLLIAKPPLAFLADTPFSSIVSYEPAIMRDGQDDRDNQSSPAERPAETPSSRPEVIETDTTPVFAVDMNKVEAIISGVTSTQNVSVAVLDLRDGKTFATGNAANTYEASGFYLPIAHIAAISGIGLSDDVPATLSAMDNAAANRLIERIGGFSELNARISASGLRNTSYNRWFGDTGSNAENLCTASDAVESLRMAYDSGQYASMQADLGAIGVAVPSGTSVHAHSGIGIKNAVNVFVIVSSPRAEYAVAVLTANMGDTSQSAQNAAAPLISDILRSVHEQVEASLA